jgi:hypothetical protein
VAQNSNFNWNVVEVLTLCETLRGVTRSKSLGGNKIMKRAAFLVAVMLGITAPVFADVRIGLNLGVYPQLVPVPGYPVYYAPRVDGNYFFYDGLYWVLDGDEWYASSWYNGPWRVVPAFDVPSFILRVPVRYYRHAPAYFRGWSGNSAPRWGEHWGRDWEQRRGNWNERGRAAVPARAPLPTYQRQYAGNRYPQAEQQRQMHTQNYRYQPREEVARQHYQQSAPARQEGRGQDQGGGHDRGGGRER